MKIGYFTDPHLRENVPGTSTVARRMSRLMKTRLEECVETFRREKVDLVVCTGDIVDDETHPSVPEDLALIRNVLVSGFPMRSNPETPKLNVPIIMIPGNHDPYPGVFYEVFERPEFLMVMGLPRSFRGRYQILTFVDYCEPGEKASERDRDSMVRMEKALSYKPEAIDRTITLQHYVIYPEGLKGYPYNYKNATAIREVMEKSETKVLSISGHYHRGLGPTEHNGVTYFAGKALCEEPFPCYVIELEGKDVRVREIRRSP